MAKGKSENTANEETSTEEVIIVNEVVQNDWTFSKVGKGFVATSEDKSVTVLNMVKGGMDSSDSSDIKIRVNHSVVPLKDYLEYQTSAILPRNKRSVGLDATITNKLTKKWEVMADERREGTLSIVKEFLSRCEVDCPITVEHIAHLE